MKSKIITTIILEGTDGVGKDTVANILRQDYSRHYGIYVRGELSDYVFAKKFNRPFISTQRGLPILYVLLVANEDEIKKRIVSRNKDICDIDKIKNQQLFINAYHKFKSDYHIICVDTSNLNAEQVAKTIWTKVKKYCSSLQEDETINEYNGMYKKGCDKLGLTFKVINNQPYINNQTIMADAQLHNGSYETFSDKTMPHNFIFSLGYDNNFDVNDIKKEFDFCYIIGSKINVRPEVLEYLSVFEKNNMRCITKQTYQDKVFGDDYLKRIAKAEATVYCCRDLAYLKMITVRPYEAALSNQILFVDKLSDPDNEILQQIHGKTSELSNLLYVTPSTICDVYKSLSKEIKDKIICSQSIWYNNLKNKIMEEIKNEN